MDSRHFNEIMKQHENLHNLEELERMKREHENADKNELSRYQCGDTYAVNLVKLADRE
jgi:hypothetical protein